MEWQPIETAPKDGRDVLTYQNDGWGVVTAMWNGRSWLSGFEPAMDAAGYSYSFNPTHWMPLPEAPKEQP